MNIKVATERVVEVTEILHEDPRRKITLNTIRFNNGGVIIHFPIMEMKSPGFVSVSARDNYGRFVLVKLCRQAIGMSTESVAGACASGEKPEDTATREMIDETGLRPKLLHLVNPRGSHPLTDCVINPCYLILAFNCAPTTERRVQDEVQGLGKPLFLTPEEVWQKILNGDIVDMATITGYFAHLAHEAGKLKL